MLTSRGCPYKCTYCFNKEIVDLYLDEGGAKSMQGLPARTTPSSASSRRSRAQARHPAITHPHLRRRPLHPEPRLRARLHRGLPEGGDRPALRGQRARPVVSTTRWPRQLADVRLHDRASTASRAGSPRDPQGGALAVHDQRADRGDAFARAPTATTCTPRAFVMFGLPIETREEITETLRLCARVKMGRFRWAIFFPFPGTAGYTIAQRRDLIDYEKMGGHGQLLRRLLPEVRRGARPAPREAGRAVPLVRQRPDRLGLRRTYRELVRRGRGDGPRDLPQPPRRTACARDRDALGGASGLGPARTTRSATAT